MSQLRRESILGQIRSDFSSSDITCTDLRNISKARQILVNNLLSALFHGTKRLRRTRNNRSFCLPKIKESLNSAIKSLRLHGFIRDDTEMIKLC